ncbi:S8 family peptidase [Tenacibaculum agarivorans]|uniref:S8 family peptidase n=1 Tax=Tenacibaculum agarivorans TaxID=1908389 RepID=UPI000AA1295D|nr:S8 family serine peptidase [Tenacibaculum agarivorans]
MRNNEYYFKKLNSGANPWPFIIGVLLVLLVLMLLRHCNTPNKFWGDNTSYEYRVIPIFPDKPNLLRPIDTTKIIIPDDPIKRPIISNLLNVYVQDTIDLKQFAAKVIDKYSTDSLLVTYYADAYKRIQFEIPSNKRNELKKSIKQDFSVVKFVCYESILSSSKKNTDPGFNNPNYSWFYEQIGLYRAWDITMGNEDIKIAVIDDSFDATHPELSKRIEKPWNVYEYSDNVKTYNKLIHGTHVAGTAVGEKNNNLGISGVAPNCKLIPVQIADQQGRMTTSSILDGIFYALKNDADVINLSLGINMPHLKNLTEKEQEMYSKTTFLEEAEMWNEVYEIAQKENTVIVQAAGNSSVLAALDPMKRSKATIIVGATNQDKKIANFSNYGEKVDVYAPGVAIYSSLPNGKFDVMDGTSMSSPIVSGCVGLIKSINDSLSITSIKKLIRNTGLTIKDDNKLIQIDNILLQIK